MATTSLVMVSFLRAPPNLRWTDLYIPSFDRTAAVYPGGALGLRLSHPSAVQQAISARLAAVCNIAGMALRPIWGSHDRALPVHPPEIPRFPALAPASEPHDRVRPGPGFTRR